MPGPPATTSWDPVWDGFFASRVLRRYPSEDLIRFVVRRLGGDSRSAVRVLDLGCGQGANTWYLAREGYAASGIDGSAEAVAQARERLDADHLAADLRVADLVDVASVYEPESFDAVVDVGSVQHNGRAAAEAIVAGVRRVLRPGGWLFTTTIAAGSTGQGTGSEVEPGTEVDLRGGTLEHTGLCRFSTLEDVRALLEGFEIVETGYFERAFADGSERYRHWVVEARRPA